MKAFRIGLGPNICSNCEGDDLKEYNELVDDMFIVLYINSQQYFPDNYKSKFVAKTVFSDTLLLKSDDPKTVVFKTQKNRVITQDSMLYLGLMGEDEREFFEIQRFRTYQGT